MFARALSGTVFGLDGHLIQIEVDLSRGLPFFDIVGLPDASMRESRDRVRTALRNSGFPMPAARIIINLAPADLPKTGPACDLAIGLALLAAMGEVPAASLQKVCIVGELSLDGGVHQVPGVLPIALAAAAEKLRLLAPADSRAEATLVPGLSVTTVNTLREAVALLRGDVETVRTLRTRSEGDARRLQRYRPVGTNGSNPDVGEDDLRDVRGQDLAKRALEIAAAGDHNLLMVGPPGVGKTMLARRMTSIMPPLAEAEHLDVCRIYSIAGMLQPSTLTQKERPWRGPHHSATRAGLLGGGRGVPGEISLAHHGVLFLDELNEFPRPLLESLRQPLEDGHVVLARLPRPVRFPARFTLIAASNPCPCGYYGDERYECRCRQSAVEAYRTKLSGPLADRMGLYVELTPPTWQQMSGTSSSASSREVRDKVMEARARQLHRFGDGPVQVNGRMTPTLLKRHCPLDGGCEALLRFAVDSLHLSARAVHRTLKVARTIADLENCGTIRADHIHEALALRPLPDHSLTPDAKHMDWPSAGGGHI